MPLLPTDPRLVVVGRPNDGTGDDLRTAFEKVNRLLIDLFTDAPVDGGINTGPGDAGGGANVYASKEGTKLSYRSLYSDNDSVQITVQDDGDGEYINLRSLDGLSDDPAPTVGNVPFMNGNTLNPNWQAGIDLNLNGHQITGYGNIGNNITINGVNFLEVMSILDLMFRSNSASLDFGSINDTNYVETTFNFGTFNSPTGPNLNFGNLY